MDLRMDQTQHFSRSKHLDPKSIEEHNVIERYVTGRLSDDEAARFEEYFLEHPECAVQVQLAQRLQRGLEAVAAREVVQTAVATSMGSRFLRSRAAIFLPLLLVAVALLPLFLYQRIGQLEEDLAATQHPRVNTPIFELTAFRSAEINATPPHLLTLSAEPEWIVLALALSERELPAYDAELRSASKGSLWQASDLRPDPLGRLVITVPSTLLPPGDYEFEVEGVTGTGTTVPAGRFAMRVDTAP